MHDPFANKQQGNLFARSPANFRLFWWIPDRLVYHVDVQRSVLDKSDTVRDFPNESAFSSQNAVLFDKLRVLMGDLCCVDPDISPQCAVGCNLCFLAEYNERLTLLIK